MLQPVSRGGMGVARPQRLFDDFSGKFGERLCHLFASFCVWLVLFGICLVGFDWAQG